MAKKPDKLGFWTRIMGSYTYYLNSSGNPVYITKFEGCISGATIKRYEELFDGLKEDKLRNCIRAVEAEAKRFDTFIPLNNPVGIAFITLVISVMIQIVNISTISKPIGDIPIHPSTGMASATWMLIWKIVYFGVEVLFALIIITWSLRIDSIKRAHIDLILSILKQKVNDKRLSKPSDIDNMFLIERLGSLMEKGYVTTEEFETKKKELLSML